LCKIKNSEANVIYPFLEDTTLFVFTHGTKKEVCWHLQTSTNLMLQVMPNGKNHMQNHVILKTQIRQTPHSNVLYEELNTAQQVNKSLPCMEPVSLPYYQEPVAAYFPHTT